MCSIKRVLTYIYLKNKFRTFRLLTTSFLILQYFENKTCRIFSYNFKFYHVKCTTLVILFHDLYSCIKLCPKDKIQIAPTNDSDKTICTIKFELQNKHFFSLTSNYTILVFNFYCYAYCFRQPILGRDHYSCFTALRPIFFFIHLNPSR